MEELCRDLLLCELERWCRESLENMDFGELLNSAALRALKDIQAVMQDDTIPEEMKAPYIESALIKNGIEGSEIYE